MEGPIPILRNAVVVGLGVIRLQWLYEVCLTVVRLRRAIGGLTAAGGSLGALAQIDAKLVPGGDPDATPLALGDHALARDRAKQGPRFC